MYFIKTITKFIAISVFALITNKANGQNYVLTGHLKDSLTSEELSYASIYNKTNNNACNTDINGEFRITLNAGQNELRISHVGCEPKLIQLYAIQNIDTLFLMGHHQHHIDDIIITGEKNRLLLVEKDQIGKEILSQSGTKPISSLLNAIPGVNSLSTGYSIAKPMVQGMYGSRVVVMNNGVKQEDQQWGQEHGLGIDPANTEKIELIKGAEALRYSGDAIGGILRFEPRSFQTSDTVISGINSSNTDNGRQYAISGFSELAKVNKLSGLFAVRVHASYKRSGNLKTPDYYLPNTGFKDLNFSVALLLLKNGKNTINIYSNYNYNQPGILSYSHFGNLTDLQKAINNEIDIPKGNFSYAIARPTQKVSHFLNKAEWNYQFTPKANLTFIYSYQENKRKEYDSHNYFNKTAPSMDIKLITQQMDAVLTWHNGKGLLLKTGVSGSIQNNTYVGRYFIPNYHKTDIMQYTIARYKKGRSELELGYRFGEIAMQVYKWEQNSIKQYNFKYHGVSWQAGWLYKINTDWQTVLQVGKAWRNPNISELFSGGLHHGAAAIEYGDINLKPEESLSGNWILKHQHNKTLLELELFVKHINNYIYLNPKLPAELTIRGAFPAFEYAHTNALFKGIDLYLSRLINNSITFSEKMSLLQANDLKNKNYLNNIAPYRFEHGLTLSATKLHSKISVFFIQVLKQNRYTAGTDYAPPPKGYILTNIALNAQPFKNKPVTIYFSMDNVLNVKYRNYLNRFRYFTDESGRLTTIGINLNF